MSINDSYNEEAIVEAIAVALDNFYTNLIKKVDSLNIKAVMKRKNPYLFRAKAMNGAAQIIDAILAAFVSSSEETIFGNVFFEPIATAAAQGQKALAEGVDIMVERDNSINLAQEMQNRGIRLIYPIFIAYEKANRDAYHQSIKKCIDHIAAEYARIGISIPATFDYRLFFIFLPLSEVKQIKESVIQWIDSQEPLI